MFWIGWLFKIFQNIFTLKLYEKLKLYPYTLGFYQFEIYLNAYLNMWLFNVMQKIKELLSVIITLNNIHEFNILRYNLWMFSKTLASAFNFNILSHILWILSKKLISVFDWHTLPCLCPLRCVFCLLRTSIWERRPNIVHCQWTQLWNFQWNGLSLSPLENKSYWGTRFSA
jgi:hypothetical protein